MARSKRWSMPVWAAAWVVCLALVCASPSRAATYYLAPNGSDTNPGTVSEPWRTLSKANQEVRAGDTVYLREGEYAGQQIGPAQSGSAGNYITYAAYQDETPVLTDVAIAINLDNRSYIRIDGLTVDGKSETWPDMSVNQWVTMNNSHHNIIENSTFLRARGWGCVFLHQGSS